MFVLPEQLHKLQATKQCDPDSEAAKLSWYSSSMHEQENDDRQRQQQMHRHQLLPDWYWLGPYGPLDSKVDCHVNPQTVECLNHLRRQRLA